MSIYEKLGKVFGVSTKELDVEEYMNAAEMDNVDVMHEPADHYIKPVALQTESDAELIKKELSNGDIARIDNEKILITPKKIKIIKSKKQGQK